MYDVDETVTPLGGILLAADETALTGLWFVGQKHFARGLGETRARRTDVIARAEMWLEAYFAGENPRIDFEIRPAGTAFEREIWRMLREIPYGQVTTYGELAARYAAVRGMARMSARAVGGAVGRNPVSILVPCHRVVGANGSLTGYAGGVERKNALLTLEGAFERSCASAQKRRS